MYKEYWGLKEFPFENVPDPSFLVPFSQYREAIDLLTYVVEGRKGAALLTGEIGCGKTTIVHTLIERLLKKGIEIGLITHPTLTSELLLEEIYYQLGGEVYKEGKRAVLQGINEILLRNFKEGKDTVIIIDEAQAIKNEDVFEEIRLLMNFQLHTRFLITVLLVGQPELKNRILRLRQLSQRIPVRYHLTPLSMEETYRYILYRLKKAGAKRVMYTRRAVELIYRYSLGIPREINILCDLSLFKGYNMGVSNINSTLIERIIEERGGIIND